MPVGPACVATRPSSGVATIAASGPAEATSARCRRRPSDEAHAAQVMNPIPRPASTLRARRKSSVGAIALSRLATTSAVSATRTIPAPGRSARPAPNVASRKLPTWAEDTRPAVAGETP